MLPHFNPSISNIRLFNSQNYKKECLIRLLLINETNVQLSLACYL